ncbi:MAG: CDP-diacylglycerol--glycerol-3-phosphate 3-phosphatidyltransferase [Gammaproteobacteria bacterium]|nr:CDP-diacylglycerol--glycerol-3-phosphate 3-phosphatidyltransferase [Gammaproteobacteria bacterium]
MAATDAWRRQLPLALTWLRVALVPVFVIVFYLPFQWARPLACFLFALAGITDFIDGYLARKWGVVSKFGAFLDPVADKIMVAVALVLLVEVDPNRSVLLTLSAAVIIGREITVSALREWMAEEGLRSKVSVSWIGKTKTVLQMVAIGFLVYEYDTLIWPIELLGLSIGVYETGMLLLIIAAILTLWSMLDYLRNAMKAFQD